MDIGKICRVTLRMMAVFVVLYALQNMTACTCNGDTSSSDPSGDLGDSDGNTENETDCDDTKDNDGDGDTDCNDSDCKDDDACDDNNGESINELPNGVGITGQVDGEEVEVDEDDIESYISLAEYTFSTGDKYFAFDITVTHKDSGAEPNITVYLHIEDESQFREFEKDKTYALDPDDLNTDTLGQIKVVKGDVVYTYDIDSALIYFDKIGDDEGDDVSGRMQVVSQGSETELIVGFDGKLGMISF